MSMSGQGFLEKRLMAAEIILVHAPNSHLQPGMWTLSYVQQLTSQLKSKPNEVKSYQTIFSRL